MGRPDGGAGMIPEPWGALLLAATLLAGAFLVLFGWER